MEAAHHGHADVMSALLESGASLGTTDKKGCTALMLASAEGHAAAVRMLLGANSSTSCKIDAQNALGRSALLLAIHTGSVETTVALLEAGANLYKKNKSGITALEIARNAHHWPVVGVLLAYGAEKDTDTTANMSLPEMEVIKAAQALLLKAAKHPDTCWAKWVVMQGPRIINPTSGSSAKHAKAVVAILDAQQTLPEDKVVELRALCNIVIARKRGDIAALKEAADSAGALKGGFFYGEYLAEMQRIAEADAI